MALVMDTTVPGHVPSQRLACTAALALVLTLTSFSLGAQEISSAKLDELTRAYAERRRENPELQERSREQIAAEVLEIMRAARDRMPDTSEVSARSVEGSVAASARCKQGYVVGSRHSASRQDVSIVSEEPRDCDARGCRAYEVQAVSESTVPFDLTVSVVCAS